MPPKNDFHALGVIGTRRFGSDPLREPGELLRQKRSTGAPRGYPRQRRRRTDLRKVFTALLTCFLTTPRTIVSTSRRCGKRAICGTTPMTTPHDVHATVHIGVSPPTRSGRARNLTALRQCGHLRLKMSGGAIS